MAELVTTQGRMTAAQAGMILPHEHVFVDLRTWDQPGYAEAQVENVISLMAPELERARQAGVTALVECTPLGVGRRADILKAVSTAARFPLVVPTGVYREPWILPWIHEEQEDNLCGWMQAELEGEIEGSGVQAGFIKLSAGDDGMTATERKVLRAAARAARPCQALIGSHTIRGWVVRDQLDTLEAAGYTSTRFVWIHAQAEADFNLNLEMARRGAWISYDGIGAPGQDDIYIDRIRRMFDAGLGDRVMLSHDRGWYDPAKPGGGTPMPFTYLCEVFLPRLRAAGFSDDEIELLTRGNPFRAFARE